MELETLRLLVPARLVREEVEVVGSENLMLTEAAAVWPSSPLGQTGLGRQR